jgi:hypothetical protein
MLREFAATDGGFTPALHAVGVSVTLMALKR